MSVSRTRINTIRSVPKHVDSVEKLMHRLSAVATVPVTYNGKYIRKVPPKRIYLSPSLLRAFRCHVGCTACCLSITLDFTEEEFKSFTWKEDIANPAYDKFHPRRIAVNGKSITIMTYPQYQDPSCPFLRPVRENGAMGCGFWTASNSTQPLECAAAPQISMSPRGVDATVIMKRPFGRGWNWKVKPECEFEPIMDSPGDLDRAVDLADEIALLHRYQHWADIVHIPTHLPAIITAMPSLKDNVKQQGLHLIQII